MWEEYEIVARTELGSKLRGSRLRSEEDDERVGVQKFLGLGAQLALLVALVLVPEHDYISALRRLYCEMVEKLFRSVVRDFIVGRRTARHRWSACRLVGQILSGEGDPTCAPDRLECKPRSPAASNSPSRSTIRSAAVSAA